jgi:hypothetical protein
MATQDDSKSLARDAEWQAFFGTIDRMKAILRNPESAGSHALFQLVWEDDAFRERLRAMLKRYRKNAHPPWVVESIKTGAELHEIHAKNQHKLPPTARELYSVLADTHGLTKGQIKNILYPVKRSKSR